MPMKRMEGRGEEEGGVEQMDRARKRERERERCTLTVLQYTYWETSSLLPSSCVSDGITCKEQIVMKSTLPCFPFGCYSLIYFYTLHKES